MSEVKKPVKLKSPGILKREENLKNGVRTQFKAGEEQAKIASKGGKKSQRIQKEKRTARQMLEIAMSYKPVLTPELRRNLEMLGADPDKGHYTAGMMAMIALINKAMKGDVRATQLWLEITGQDPRVLIEQKRLAMEQTAAERQPGFAALDEAFDKLGPGDDR